LKQRPFTRQQRLLVGAAAAVFALFGLFYLLFTLSVTGADSTPPENYAIGAGVLLIAAGLWWASRPRCPRCGTWLRQAQRYCPRCGEELG